MYPHSTQERSENGNFQNKMPQLAGKRFMQMKVFGFATFILSLIIVFIELNASRNWCQHWLRISILHMLFTHWSDADFHAYMDNANMNKFYCRIWYSVRSYVSGITVLSIQWIFNLAYIIQLISGSSTDLS